MLTYLFVLVLAFAQETPEDTNPLSQPMMLQTETTHPSLRTILNLIRNQKKDIKINENLHHGWARRTHKGYAKGLIKPRSQWDPTDLKSDNDDGDLLKQIILLLVQTMMKGGRRSPAPQMHRRRKHTRMYAVPSPPSPPPPPVYSPRYVEPSPPWYEFEPSPPPVQMHSAPYFAEASHNDVSWEPAYADYGY